MTRAWRWLVVAAGTALLVALPFRANLLPAGHSSVGAASLLARIQGSAGVQYSGYAESTGGLALPVTDRFNSINDLFGDTTQLRVWWRGADDWRVDAVDLTGESDLHHDRLGTWTWDYETNTARRTIDDIVPVVRLPRADDLVPSNLARRLLSQATPIQAIRLPDARIAGHTTAGLRISTQDARSTIDHIDVWALPGDGLPVRVRVYAVGSSTPVLATSLLDLSTSAPGPADTAFQPTAAARVRSGQNGDIVSTIDRFGRNSPPDEVAGLPRQPLDLGAVGVYGRGVTVLVAVPLPRGLAQDLTAQLETTPGSSKNGARISVAVGPVSLLMSGPGFDASRWLLAGTVTAATLDVAANGLPPAVDFRR